MISASPSWGASAPRTRGWFAAQRPVHCCGGVRPAHAGMVRVGTIFEMGCFRRPRARGDGSAHHRDHPRPRQSAPRTRGWFAGVAVLGAVADVGPAHAGMVRTSRRTRRCDVRRPRARGDGSSLMRASRSASWSAPRTRGWFYGCPGTCPFGRVGPAHAGMVPWPLAHTPRARCRPRARGDGSVSDALAQAPARPARQPGRRHHPAGLVAGGQGWRPGGRHGRPVASAQTGPAAHLGRPSIWSWWRISANISRRCNTVNSPSSSPLRRGSR